MAPTVIIHFLHSCHLHNQNPVAFNGGKPFVRVAARLVRVSAFITDHTAGSQRHSVTKLLPESFLDLPGNLLVIPFCFQAAVHIIGIGHVRNSGEHKHMLIFAASLHTFLNRTDHRRASPGMVIAFTVLLTDLPHMGRKNKILRLQTAIFADWIFYNKIFNNFPMVLWY